MWPVKHGQPYATEIERWIYANLVAAFFERFDELRELDYDNPLDYVDVTERFDALSTEAKLAAVCGSAIAIMNPLTPLGGQNAILAEAGAIPFECLKGLIAMEIDTAKELTSVGSGDSLEGVYFWRRQVLLFFYGLHGLSLVDMVEDVLCDESSEYGELSEADIQVCRTQAQDAFDQNTYLDFLPWIPKSPQETDIEQWEDLIESYLMDDRLFQDHDWLISLPSSHPELPDAAVLELQFKNQEIQATVGIAPAYFDMGLSQRQLKPWPDLRRELEAYWVVPHLQTPVIVHRIVEALGQGHLLGAHPAEDSEPEAWRSGAPKRVQDLLEKTIFREGCHLALNIAEPGEVDQLVPITHISVLEAEAGYGVGGRICEFETEAGAAAIGDTLNPEAIEEVVVLRVEGLASFFRPMDDAVG
ncbi:hypothetical protein IQ254_28915 [Nodosilinea sp. LEGE 07088]|uniref:hypothetical protein n=1 Tax=Nodosilinea sp. LEGE 07088 TaxID=2777968 RepID=UPI001A05D606|nr:hypothetical protein [Nodosilinea sp. LEGE 07088]MBE9141176.1 hypothetical protein [Nodosilinea sp. LEGE 07088]